MKKIVLTLLLVVAYQFGSAFALTDSHKQAAREFVRATGLVDKIFAAQMGTYKKSIHDKFSGKDCVSKSEVDAFINESLAIMKKMYASSIAEGMAKTVSEKALLMAADGSFASSLGDPDLVKEVSLGLKASKPIMRAAMDRHKPNMLKKVATLLEKSFSDKIDKNGNCK